MNLRLSIIPLAFILSLGFNKYALPKLPGRPVIQLKIAQVDKMPFFPQPYAYRDWKKTAIDFDKYVFDFNQTGANLPFIWWDTAKRNFNDTTFGLYTAIGDVRMGPDINHGENHESLGAFGALLGASLVGIDKSNQQGHDFIKMMRNYFNKDNGWNVVMNFTNEGAHVGGGYGNDFWYEVHNNVLFWCLADLYPGTQDFENIQRTIADQFYRSDSVMKNGYSFSYFDFKNMKGGINNIPAQEDVAGGYAFILYSAWIKFRNPKYLKAARHAIDILYHQKENRFYEAMMPFAALIAARLNAETGDHYEIQRFLDWTFNGTAVGREGWGVIADRWGGYDVSGLAGSTVHNGGYGFLMNTFDLMLPLSALVRYDQRYATAFGKWILNASNAARFCYPDELPDSLQALPQFKSLTQHVIAYEGIIKESTYKEFKGKSPFAQGDGPLWVHDNPPQTMFSVYGSGHVGIFGSTIKATHIPWILEIDCTKTDFYKNVSSYPTLLYYNPYPEKKEIIVDGSNEAMDIYDSTHQKLIAKGVKGDFTIFLDPQAATIIVKVPSGKKWHVRNHTLMVDHVAIDFRYGL